LGNGRFAFLSPRSGFRGNVRCSLGSLESASDTQTNRILIARPRLHSKQRGKKQPLKVKF